MVSAGMQHLMPDSRLPSLTVVLKLQWRDREKAAILGDY